MMKNFYSYQANFIKVLITLLLLSVSLYSQVTTAAIETKQKEIIINPSIAVSTSEIKFIFLNSSNKPFKNLDVIAKNLNTNKKYTIITNTEGVAHFESLPKGRYTVFPPHVVGYRRYEINIQLKETIESDIKFTIEIQSGPEAIVIVDFEIPFHFAIYQEDLKSIQDSIARGVNVNTKDKDGMTALHVAVDSGNLEIVKTIFCAGANLNEKNKAQQTPLWMLLETIVEDVIMEKILDFLVSNGANINETNKNKETLLMVASKKNNDELVEILLKAGANVHLKDKSGKTALMKTKDSKIKQLLRLYGAIK